MKKSRLYHMNAAELLDATVAVYKQSFVQQMIVTAVSMALIGVAIFILVAFMAFVGIVAVANGLFSNLSASAVVILTAVAGIWIFAVVVMCSSAMLVANMSLTMQVFSGKPPDAGKAFLATLRSVPRVITVVAAELLMTAPVFAILGGLLYAVLNSAFSNSRFFFQRTFGSVESLESSMPIIIAAVVALSFLAFVMSLFIAALTSVAIPVSLFENRYFFGAVGKSIRLVKKDYWKILGLLVLVPMVTLGVYYSFMGIFDLLSFAMQIFPESLPAGLQPLIWTGAMASIGVNLLVTPLEGIFTALLYVNQKIKHEGLDIELEIDRLESGMLTGESS